MRIALCALVALALSNPTPYAFEARDEIAGIWSGALPVAGQIETERVRLVLTREDAGALTAVVHLPGQRFPLEAEYDAELGALHLHGTAAGRTVELRATVMGEQLDGHVSVGPARMELHLRRGTPPEEERPPLVVDFTVERTSSVPRDGLEPEVAAEVVNAIEALMDAEQVVGLSAAIVIDGALVDERHFGWEDFHGRVPAGPETSYRWASISKPLTAVVALQLAAEGALELERDVRGYVPEWPDKDANITSLQLLCHQGAVPHYAGLVPRTARATELEHPWADRVYALHMFDESPLIGAPGEQFHYTTPGYVLLGAVVERAGETPFDALVIERVGVPCGMKTLQADYPWIAIPHRTHGYHRTGDDRVVDSGDNEVSWKLPAGGWTSTVGDLARFAVGVTSDELLDEDWRERMWTRAELADGSATSYGLGWGVGALGDLRVVSHSGGQLKTSTFLLIAPDANAAVALMCNTRRTGLGDLARECLASVLAMDEGN